MSDTKEAPAKAAKPKVATKTDSTKGKRMSDETITEIRKLRAEKDGEGNAVHTHNALAKKFGVGAGTISQIVRNRTYIDPKYKPVNDRA